MLDEIMKEIENSKGPLTVKDLARRLDVEESALVGMLEFLERKGKLSVYRPDDRYEECSLISCTSCVFKSACPNSEEGGVS